MIVMALLHVADLENSECKPEVAVAVSMTEISLSHVRWLFLSNFSEEGPVGIFKCGSRKEKYLGSVTIERWVSV